MSSLSRRLFSAAGVRRGLADRFAEVTGYRIEKLQTRPAGPVIVNEPLPPFPGEAAPPVPLARLQQERAVRGDRLLESPGFVLSSVRSGSTLLRVILDSHSELYAPHELHLRRLNVQLADRYVADAMREMGLDRDELQFLLWDRVLHREMVRRDKRRVVNKTPSDAFIWRRILRAWPDARFVYLLRHPAAVVASWHRARPKWSRQHIAEDVLRYMIKVEEARQSRDGLTVRYEDLTIDPERETRRICEYLGVHWEAEMLDYRAGDHGRFRAGLGDWTGKIKSGEIQPVRDLPPDDAVPSVLRDIGAAWGYLPASSRA